MSLARDHAVALSAAFGAFALWGLAPIYFKLFGAVSAHEIIAHRIIWSVFFLAGVLALRHRSKLGERLQISRKTLGALAISGTLIVVNWLIFVFAINTDRVLSTSLGYFINPLVAVVLGLVIFREKLVPVQTLAVLIAASGTLYLTLRVGQFPWIALGLAGSFALYSLVRKLTDVGPMVGLFWETVLMMPFAVIWLVLLGRQEQLVFNLTNWGLAALLIGTGLVTVIPLLLFATGVRRLPLSTVGIMQYLAPSITFILAVFVYAEPFTVDHAMTFGCIWVSLALFSWAGWTRMKRARIPV